VPRNYAEAEKWFRMAAEQGDADAQLGLGVMYYKGLGVVRDDLEAVKWFRLAAPKGQPDAQLNLGLMYLSGQGVLQDHTTAHMWLNIAGANGAENGHTGRDIAASQMTAEAIAEAQKRARICMESDYQNCE